jgi:hypothetical protein
LIVSNSNQLPVIASNHFYTLGFYERSIFDAAQRKQIVATEEWLPSRQGVKQHVFGGTPGHQAREVPAQIHWQPQEAFRTAISRGLLG